MNSERWHSLTFEAGGKRCQLHRLSLETTGEGRQPHGPSIGIGNGRCQPHRLASEAGPTTPPLVVVNHHSDAAGLLDACAEATQRPFNLLTTSDFDWNDDLSPWPAETATPKSAPFAGNGMEHLTWLTEQAIPQAEKLLGSPAPMRLIAGYSLAGLFALWAAYKCDAFAGAASVSGSLWYPGFAEYAAAYAPASSVRNIYLSLGDRESKTRNPLFASNEVITRSLAASLSASGMGATFELNPGNHFQDADARLARGIAWLVSHCGSPR